MLTPAEARALVEKHGGKRQAARAYGVDRSTFRYWLDPETQKARVRARYYADPEPKREQCRRYYEGMSGVDRNRKLLSARRNKALRRMDERNQRVKEAI